MKQNNSKTKTIITQLTVVKKDKSFLKVINRQPNIKTNSLLKINITKMNK